MNLCSLLLEHRVLTTSVPGKPRHMNPWCPVVCGCGHSFTKPGSQSHARLRVFVEEGPPPVLSRPRWCLFAAGPSYAPSLNVDIVTERRRHTPQQSRKKNLLRDFPDGPMAKTPHSQCRGPGVGFLMEEPKGPTCCRATKPVCLN